MRKPNNIKCIFAVVIPLIVSSTFLRSQDTSFVKFEKVAVKEDLPIIFNLVDDLIADLYDEYYRKNKPKDFAILYNKYYQVDSLYNSTARLMAHISYHPKIYEHIYFTEANRQFNDYNKERDKDQPRLVKPSIMYYHLKRLLVDMLPWDWQFHFANRYILTVKVLSKQKSRPGSSRDVGPYYVCQVLDDIKGNFKGEENSNFIGNFVRREMEVGNDYLILVWGSSNYENEYLIRGHATHGEGIFPLIDNIIYDHHGRLLGLGHYKINIDDYKKIINNFNRDKIGINNY